MSWHSSTLSTIYSKTIQMTLMWTKPLWMFTKWLYIVKNQNRSMKLIMFTLKPLSKIFYLNMKIRVIKIQHNIINHWLKLLEWDKLLMFKRDIFLEESLQLLLFLLSPLIWFKNQKFFQSFRKSLNFLSYLYVCWYMGSYI